MHRKIKFYHDVVNSDSKDKVYFYHKTFLIFFKNFNSQIKLFNFININKSTTIWEQKTWTPDENTINFYMLLSFRNEGGKT